MPLNPCFITGVVTTPLENFFLSPQNQKESDRSHVGDLSDILHGHFDQKKKKNGVPPYPGLG